MDEAERPRCPQCGVLLIAPGTQTRTLVTEHDQSLELARSYATCPQCGAGLFPLDEELALLPGTLTLSLHEALVRLGARMPFRSVVEELAYLKHVTTTEATVRRHAETAGAAYVAWQTETVEQVERTLPTVPEGAAHQLMSTDGAMVPPGARGMSGSEDRCDWGHPTACLGTRRKGGAYHPVELFFAPDRSRDL